VKLTRSSTLLALATLVSCSQPEESSRAPAVPYAYPLARAGDQVDEQHGRKVPDPYRALEDPAAPETRAWVDAQNALTKAHLESVSSLPAIRSRLAEVWNHERYGVPLARGGRYFFTRNDGLQNQSVLLVSDGLRSEPRVLLDPNALSQDGTTALSGVNVSDDGKLLAYGISKAGSDWQEWRVRDVGSATDLPDVIRWVKFSSASWTKDGKGFFYSRYDEPKEATRLEDVNYFQKLFYHRLGTPQSDDALVHHAPEDKELGFDGDVTEDGRYLVIMIRRGSDPRRRVAFKDLEGAGGSVVDLVSGFEAAYDFLGNDGPVFWFLTDHDAPRGRIVAIDTRAPGRIAEVVPQAAETLTDAEIVGDRFIASYLEHASTRVRMYRLDGSPAGEVALPGLGAASGFTGRRADTETFYSFTSFTTPTEIHRLDLKRGEDTVFHRPRIAFDRSAYETSQSFYASKDGTKVPIFVTHRKGMIRDGRNPTLLYGYGGFNISITPFFSPATLVWLEMGGVYAVANIRGGGEYGEEWHEAGTKLRKQNVFDDFIAASEWLIREKITSTPRLAITGRSNGGLLAGACITQRPDLFGAAIVDVGVLDMLRFHKFTIGWAWVSDFGSAEDAAQFQALLAYSPYHNVRKGAAYPATLITTADHDDRVVPAHSYKFAAALQAAQGGPEPILLRVDTKSGHGAGKPTSKLIEEAADKLAFLVKELGLSQTPPSP